MKKIKKVILGIDFTIGMGSYLLVSLLLGQNFDLRVLGFSLLMAFFPDLDFIPYTLLRMLGVKKLIRIPSHWLVGHYVIPVFILAAAFTYYVSIFLGVSFWYLMAIASWDLKGHFIHDGQQEQSFCWLWPFWKKFFFLRGLIVVVKSKATYLRHVIDANRKREKAKIVSLNYEINSRLGEGTSKLQKMIWTILVIGILSFAILSYYYPAAQQTEPPVFLLQ